MYGHDDIPFRIEMATYGSPLRNSGWMRRKGTGACLKPDDLFASSRVYKINDEKEYDPTNRLKAFEIAQEWGERIPIGIIYRGERSTLNEQEPAIREESLLKQRIDQSTFESIFDSFK